MAAGAALLATATARAQTTPIFFVGGNSTVKLIQNRWSTLFGGTLTANSTNANIFRYAGSTVPGVPGTVTADFNLTGGAGAINDLKNQAAETIYDNTTALPVAAITAVQPETVNIDGSIFTEVPTVIVPVVYVKNNTLPNDLANITNLTQRNAYYLEGSGGTVPTAYFGGSPNSNAIPANALYFVGRNSLSAVRQLIDANIYFASTAVNYKTNAQGKPIKYTTGNNVPWGAGSGPEVAAIVGSIPNSIGTVAAQDVGTLAPLNYEGVPYSTNNVINGSYPLWGEEIYLYYPSGGAAPSANQQTVITALANAVSDPDFGHTNTVFLNKFVEVGDLQVSRTGDGGPITSTLY
jgi:hypothetical protein